MGSCLTGSNFTWANLLFDVASQAVFCRNFPFPDYLSVGILIEPISGRSWDWRVLWSISCTQSKSKRVVSNAASITAATEHMECVMDIYKCFVLRRSFPYTIAHLSYHRRFQYLALFFQIAVLSHNYYIRSIFNYNCQNRPAK